MHTFSPASLLLVLLVAFVLFGGKRVKSFGADLGAAVRSFREGLNGAAPPELPEDKKED